MTVASLVLTFVTSSFFSDNDIQATWAPFLRYLSNSEIIVDRSTRGFKQSLLAVTSSSHFKQSLQAVTSSSHF